MKIIQEINAPRLFGRFRRALLGAAAVALIATLSCGAPSAAKAGDILRIGSSQPIDSLNPFVANSDYSSVAFQYAYPFLTEYDAKLKIVPYFAQSWEVSEDHKVWTFHTTPGATWSDGKPLTAKDAAFTFNMINKFKDGPTARLSQWLAHLVTAEAKDANTLVLTYDSPVGSVLVQMQAMPILPEHVWAPLATGDGKKLSTFENKTPWVSGGPFVFAKHVKEQLALFKRNPKWWGARKPIIDGFGFQFFANDDAMVTALTSGQIDMIGEQTPPTAADSLTKAGMVVLDGPSSGYKTFIINSNEKKKKNRELLDPKVREALEYAIDRDSIVKTVWLGHATAGSTFVAPATGWHNDAIAPLPFDLTKANALLDAAGYKLGADGVRVAGDHPMSYEVIFSTEENGTGDRTFQIIQAGFKRIGINITQHKMDPDAAGEAMTAPDGKYEDFDFSMSNWVPPVDPEFVLSVMTCGQWGNTNDSGYCNADYDAMYSKQSATVEEQERRDIVNQMQAKIFNERPYIIIDYPDVLEAHSPKWTGFVLSPLVGSVNNLSTETLINVHKE
jgi:peptide/nickel transport system substrate-binding protein